MMPIRPDPYSDPDPQHWFFITLLIQLVNFFKFLSIIFLVWNWIGIGPGFSKAWIRIGSSPIWLDPKFDSDSKIWTQGKLLTSFVRGKLSDNFPGDSWRKNLTNLYRTSEHCVMYYKGKLTKSWINCSGKYWKRNLPQSPEIQPISRALFFPHSPDNFQVNFARKEMRKLNSYPHWSSPFFI